MRRVRPAAGIDRMEQEPTNFYEAVCTAYRELAAREPHRIRIIDATGSIKQIEQEIWDVISTRFSHLARMMSNRAAASGIPEPWLLHRKSRSITWPARRSVAGSPTLT